MKPYRKIPILECGEPLLPIPKDIFSFLSPHPYVKLGATYGEKSPYFLREGVLNSLLEAARTLDKYRSGWKIQIFDAYRPIEVQGYMVRYSFDSLLKENGWVLEELSPETIAKLWEKVYTIWAIPSDDPRTPPPHSTGAAVDITLVDDNGNIVDMGGEIDEMSDRSLPDYYIHSNNPVERRYRENRLLLSKIMNEAGFSRHSGEWWHFSKGDQMWAWSLNKPHAIYGRV